jgi:P63C domain
MSPKDRIIEPINADFEEVVSSLLGEPNKKLQAIYEGELKIINDTLSVAVLENKQRIISQAAVFRALGRPARGNARLINIPTFMDAKNLQPFVSDELLRVINRVEYLDVNGASQFGYDAAILPLVCDLYLQARENNAITLENQKETAKKAEILVRSLAKVGIIALIDEATGYQEIREKEALNAILDKYLRKELAAWAKTFPDDFYKEIYRLKGWAWSSLTHKRPPIIGKYTNDVVYERLAPSLVEELQRLNPKAPSENRLKKHFQWLTDDIGHPALSQHLHATIGLMRASNNWEQFKRSIDKAFPKKGTIADLFYD